MLDGRPVSPEERREMVEQLIHLASERDDLNAQVMGNIADIILSTPAGPDWPREAEWRREVMSQAKDALAGGDAKRAYEALTRHEREGYPWAPDHPSSAGPPR